MLPYSYHDGSLHSRSTSDGRIIFFCRSQAFQIISGDHNLPYSDISLDDVFAFQSRKSEQKNADHRKQDSKSETSHHETAEQVIDKVGRRDLLNATSFSISGI